MLRVKAKRWNSLLIRCFWKAVGGQSPARAVERVCARLIHDLGKTEPPFQSADNDTYDYPKLRGIPVVKTRLHCDGVLSTMGDGFLIQVNRRAPGPRKNFTVCHELGHAEVLRTANQVYPAAICCNVESFAQLREEERISDLFAINLLMPQKVFKEIVRSLQPGLRSLWKVANTFGVSLEAATRRIAELELWPCTAMIWSKPEQYRDGSLGIEIRRSVYPRGFPSLFGDQKYVTVKSDILHRAQVSCDPLFEVVDGHDQVGHRVQWAVDAMRQNRGNGEEVFTVLTRKVLENMSA